jgi:hypothetical protein
MSSLPCRVYTSSNVNPFDPGADSSCDPAVLPFERVPRDVTVASSHWSSDSFALTAQKSS